LPLEDIDRKKIKVEFNYLKVFKLSTPSQIKESGEVGELYVGVVGKPMPTSLSAVH